MLNYLQSNGIQLESKEFVRHEMIDSLFIEDGGSRRM